MDWREIAATYGYRGERIDRFGSWNLTPQSPSTTPAEPLSRAQAKGFLRIVDPLDDSDNPEPDTVQDAQIDAMCSVARRVAEWAQQMDLVRRQWDYTFDYWHEFKIPLRRPLVSVDLFQYTDVTNTPTPLVLNVDYIIDFNKRIPVLVPAPNKSWPSFEKWPSSAILIRCTTGYLPTDQFWTTEAPNLLLGMKYLVNHFYDNRDAFNRGIGNIEEFPFTVTDLLGLGSVPVVG